MNNKSSYNSKNINVSTNKNSSSSTDDSENSEQEIMYNLFSVYYYTHLNEVKLKVEEDKDSPLSLEELEEKLESNGFYNAKI